MREEFKSEIKKFIDTHAFHQEIDQVWFNDLALRIFSWQKENNLILKNYWKDCHPKSIKDIKPFPIESWKYLRCGDGSQHFASSATTTGRPSRHFFHDDDLFRYQVEKYFPEIFPDCKIYNLLEYRPHWSLYRMIEFVLHHEGKNSLLIGTSKNHYQALQNEPIHKYSKIFDTGGFKNFLCPYTQEELYQKIAEHYQITARDIIGEYGMAELFSQAYDISFEWNATERIKRTVPTLQVENFSNGPQLKFTDICNLDSCAFLLVGDAGTVLNPREFTLQGRISSLSLKGCSLR